MGAAWVCMWKWDRCCEGLGKREEFGNRERLWWLIHRVQTHWTIIHCMLLCVRVWRRMRILFPPDNIDCCVLCELEPWNCQSHCTSKVNLLTSYMCVNECEPVAKVISRKLQVLPLYRFLTLFLFLQLLQCRDSFMFIVISYTLFSCLYRKTKIPGFISFFLKLH